MTTAHTCRACRRVRARIYEGILEPGLPELRLRLLLCGACGAAKAFLVGLDPWRGPDLEAIALRPADREGVRRDGLVDLALELLAPAPTAEGDGDHGGMWGGAPGQ